MAASWLARQRLSTAVLPMACRDATTLRSSVNVYKPMLGWRGLRQSSVSRRKLDEPYDVANSAAVMEAGVTKYFCNRNPRNGEMLGIAEKPKGFSTKKDRVDYYHKLNLEISNSHISAFVGHNNGLRVVEASTKEYGIARYLYKTSDVCAAMNVGRVIAQRCKETGLYRVMWQHKRNRNHKKVKAFIDAVTKSGININEPCVRNVLPPPGELPR